MFKVVFTAVCVAFATPALAIDPIAIQPVPEETAPVVVKVEVTPTTRQHPAGIFVDNEESGTQVCRQGSEPCPGALPE